MGVTAAQKESCDNAAVICSVVLHIASLVEGIMPVKLPTYDRLMNPLLNAVRALGGSGSIEEIYDKVIELEHFPDDII